MLLEYNNGTFLRPHYEAHQGYSKDIDKISCISVNTLLSDQCEFVKNTGSCHEIEGLIDYAHFIYCVLLQSQGSDHLIFSHILLSFLIVGYCGLVSNIAYTKLCPNFISIMKIINLSEHTTGVLIISVLYGMPSLWLGYSNRLHNDDPEIFIDIILGKNVFTKTFAVGVLLINYPISIFPRYLIRDILFFLSCFCAFVYMLDTNNTQSPLYNGLILFSIWLIYCLVVLIEDIYFLYIYKGELDRYQKPIQYLSNRNREAILYKSANYRLFSQFLLKFNPLKIEKFYTNKKWLRIIYFIFFPLRIMIDLVIPAVDYQLQHDGWTKLFNCINIITLPLIIMIIYNYSIYIIINGLAISLILATYVFVTSRTDRPPSYHYIFAIYGLFGSICICYIISTELLAVLNLVGIMMQLQRGAIALLLHTPFDTFQLLVVGISIANYGYPNLSYGIFRTFGFVELAGLGTTLMTTAIVENKKSFPIRVGVFGETIIYFIFLETAATIITAFVTSFNLRKSIGWYLLGIFVIYMLFILGIQAELIHALGTDHNDEARGDWEDILWA